MVVIQPVELLTTTPKTITVTKWRYEAKTFIDEEIILSSWHRVSIAAIKVTPEVDKWFQTDLKGMWVYPLYALRSGLMPDNTIFFSEESDAVMFKLKWLYNDE